MTKLGHYSNTLHVSYNNTSYKYFILIRRDDYLAIGLTSAQPS